MTLTDDLVGALGSYRDAVAEVDLVAVEAALEAIVRVHEQGGTAFICGNGGSASAASHFATDLMKTAAVPGVAPLRSIALGDNPALLTATANDGTYDDVFADPLGSLARAGDMLVVISASGNSPSILAALDRAKALDLVTIALVGFDGGQAQASAQIVVHVPSMHYGVVETAHIAVTHLLAFGLRDVLMQQAGVSAAQESRA